MEATSQSIAADSSRVAVTLKGAASTARQPVHMIFLIDVSDSMRDQNKLVQVKTSVRFLIPLLNDTDMISLITFGDSSQVLLSCVSPTQLESVDRLQTSGCTNLSAGLFNVQQLMDDVPDAHGSPGHKHGVLLLTDGHANRGVYDTGGLMNIIGRLLEKYPSLTLTTIGYGRDHNSELLQSAAARGGGSYNVVNGLEDIATVFGEVLGGLTTVVAQNVTVTLPSGATAETAYATTTKADGQVEVRIGDIYAENEVIVLYTVSSSATPPPFPLVKGIDVSTLQSFYITPIPVAFSEPLPRSIQIAQFRYRVSQMLKSRSRSEAESLRRELRELPFAQENIVQMMIEDCETVLNHADENGNIPDGLTAGLAQHSAYLGLGRGLRTRVRDEDAYGVRETYAASYSYTAPRGVWGFAAGAGAAATDSDDEQQDPVQPPAMRRMRTTQVDYASSPFSNQRQMQTVSLMRTASAPQPQPQSPES